MKELPSGSIDMIFADPPFNVGKKYGKGGDNRRDYYEWHSEWIAEGFRLLKPTGVFCIMTLSRHLGEIFPMMHQRGVFINQIMWRNVAGAHNKRTFWPSYQPILIYGKTTAYKFNTYAQRRTAAQMKTVNGYPSRWGKGQISQGQLLDYWDDIRFVNAGNNAHPEAILKPQSYAKIHPCQAPIALPGRCIAFFTDPGDAVLDPFAGTATSMVAAQNLGRKGIAFEREIEFCRIGAARLRGDMNACVLEAATQMQGSLF